MDGAAANGFAFRGHLLLDEAWALANAGYPCPPGTRVPGGWHLSAGGVPVPPAPDGASLSDLRRREEALASLGNNGVVMGRFNRKGRRRWWGAHGRTLEFVLEHIAAGDQPRLTMPPPRPWQPRQVMSTSSSGTSSSSGARTAPARAAPPSSTPPLLNSGRRAPTRSAPPRRLVRPKTEPAAAALGEQEEEWPGQRAAEEASFNTVQPADDDFAVDWSLRDFTAEEVERQRRLLAEVEQERERAAATRRPRIPPPPEPRPFVFIKLDPSDSEEDEDEEAIRRTLLVSKWNGDDGAGPSKPPGAPGDDGGDYSQAIYNSLDIN